MGWIILVGLLVMGWYMLHLMEDNNRLQTRLDAKEKRILLLETQLETHRKREKRDASVRHVPDNNRVKSVPNDGQDASGTTEDS